jgi:hypothetical protein
MSRSRKKISVVKDQNTYAKRLGNKLFRAKVKDSLSKGKELPYDKSEVVNDWDIVDWFSFTDEKHEDYKRDKRK